jgi:hypothetical protein
VFDGALPANLALVWNPRLTATAGQVVDDGSRNSEKSSRDQRIPVRLELSAKVTRHVLGMWCVLLCGDVSIVTALAARACLL